MRPGLRRTRLASALTALGLALSAGCVGGLTIDEQPDADLSAYRTWDWLPPSPRGLYDDPRLERELTEQVERHLREMGYERVDLGDVPDFQLAYRVSVRQITRLRSVAESQENFHTGQNTGGQNTVEIERPSSLFAVPYAEALVMVGIRDTRSGEFVWKAERRDEVRGRYDEHLEPALAEILQRWPTAAQVPSES